MDLIIEWVIYDGKCLCVRGALKWKYWSKRKKTLKLEVQLDFEDVENSEFDYFFGENFRFKAPQLSEKSSESYVLHI